MYKIKNIIFIKKKEEYKCKIISKIIEENKEKKVEDEFDEIVKLKDLLMLTKKEKVLSIQNVIKVIEKISNILDILQNIINRGYDEDILYNIRIELENNNDNINEGWTILSKNGDIIKCSEEKIQNGIQLLLEYLKDIEENIESKKKKNL